MSTGAADACARRIVELEMELARWQDAYRRLASNRLRWTDRALDGDPAKARVIGVLKDHLRRTW